MDVSSLYTNIPHTEGIAATVAAYGKSKSTSECDESALEVLLNLVLKHNHFEFDRKHYLQVNGTAMGTKMAPNYANIFMASLEIPFLESSPSKPIFYRRFLDDIFFVWADGEHSLSKFISDFNSLHPSITFTHTYSQESVHFLDVTVSVSCTSISTSLYKKPTDRQQYLHFHSSHPRHCKTGVPYSQAHRYRRICSEMTQFDTHAQELRAAFLRHKYPEKIIDNAIERARSLDRGVTMEEKDGNKDKTSGANLILTYSAAAPRVNSILSRHFNILKQSSRLSTVFQTPPKVVYRRNKNLRDLLVRAKTHKSDHHQGCRPCGKPRCRVCKHMVTTNTAEASYSDFEYKIKDDLNCDSSNVVYKIRCEVCKQEYVGQTETAFRLRFNNHRAHVKGLPNLPFSKHINLPGHSFEHISVILLQSGFQNTREREQRESYFINKFKSLSHGINESPGRLTCLRDQSKGN